MDEIKFEGTVNPPTCQDIESSDSYSGHQILKYNNNRYVAVIKEKH